MTDYAELRAAIDAGPTPGPWRHTTYMSGTQNVEFPGARGVTFVDEVLDADARAICSDNDTKPFPWIDVSHRPEDSGDDRDPQRTRNARYIAAANPEAIRALLAERDALREALRWTAGALQASCVAGKVAEADTARALIGNETKSIGQILDAADAALGQGDNE